MISKVLKPSKSFARSCSYLLDKREHASVILSEGVRSYDHKKMAEDFELQADANPNIEKPVLHVILAFPPGEQIDEEKLKQITQDYLNELQLKDTQYLVVYHQDKKHQHVHVILNRVGNNGKAIKDNFLGIRGKKKAQELTLRYGMKPALKKPLKAGEENPANELELMRKEIHKLVSEGLGTTSNLQQLEAWLKQRGIEVIYKRNRKTQQVEGMSFQKGKFKYKASDIDRSFSYRKIGKRFSPKLVLKKPSVIKETLGKNPTHNLDTRLIESLLSPRKENSNTPYELIRKKRRKPSNGLGL